MEYIGTHIRKKYLEKHLSKGSGKCLDIGASGGTYKDIVVGKGYSYVGIDIEPHGPDVVYGDINKLDFPDNFFSAVICVDVLEHIKDDKTAVRELYRVLKPGGTLVMKWNEQNISKKDLLNILPEKAIYGHPTGSKNKTHWLIFYKEVL